MKGLIIITGAEGVGKSTLLKDLPQKARGYEVYDFDNVLKPYDGTKNWRKTVTKHILNLANKNLKLGKSTVVVGLIIPDEVELLNTQRDRQISGIAYCLLDCETKERARRLVQRGAGKEVIEDPEQLKLLKSGFNNMQRIKLVVDTTNMEPDRVLSKVISWLEGLENL